MFIHGLGGDAFKTWSNDKDHRNSWPYWLGAEFPDVGIWSIGYAASPSKWTRVLGWFSTKKRDAGYSMALPERALEILDAMQQNGIGQRPLLFICHSLGGLVAKQILRKSSDSVDRAKRQLSTHLGAVLFLGTPHSGSFLATLLDVLRIPLLTNRSIDDLTAHSPYLADLNDWYREFAPSANVRTKTYYETRAVFGLLKIVNRTSGSSGVGEAAVGLDKDHISIAKPDLTTSNVCVAAKNLIRESVLCPPVVVNVNVDRTLLGNATAPRIPHQLPPAAEKFFGRSAEKARVIARLRDGKNTAVVAPAGLGKTALAAEAVRAVTGDTPASLAASRFPDGVVFLDLYASHGSLGAVLVKLATSLQGEDFMANSLPHDRATAACRSKRMLVIIEGGEEADGMGDHGNINDLFSTLSPENCWLLLTRLSTQAAPDKSVELKEALDATDAAALLDSLTSLTSLTPGRVTKDVRTRVLALLEGHPLAITWAGNLLARGDEDPARLATDWAAETLPTLTDPEKATRTLEWLFARSVRGLDDTAKQALVAAGLLARAPFPLAAINAATGSSGDERHCRNALKALVQRGILQLTGETDHWQFTHVLGYRFARDETGADAGVRRRLALWLNSHLRSLVTPTNALAMAHQVPRCLDHVGALLRTDFDQTVWYPLASEMQYDMYKRLTELGRLGQASAALAAVEGWFTHVTRAADYHPQWQREESVLMNRQGDVRRAQGDQVGALTAYQAAMDAAKALAASDPSNKKRQRDLSVSQIKVGNVRFAQGDVAGALTAYQASMGIVKTLAACDPSDAMWSQLQYDLSVSHERVGAVRLKQGDLARALTAFQASMEIIMAMAASDPSNAEWQRQLSVSHNKVGDVRLAQGDLAGALTAFQAAMDEIKALATSDTSNAAWQRDLSFSFKRLADVYRHQGEKHKAVEHAEQSLQIDERLAAMDPSNATWQEDVELSREVVARLKGSAG